MEAVIFDGKEYTKASVVAKRFNYTSDYVGQLCRGKKVDARLVGRSWYINIESLITHRQGRYQDSTSKTATEATTDWKNDTSTKYLSRIDVEPILKKKTVNVYKSFDGNVTKVPVKYEPDDFSLLPVLQTNATKTTIKVDPAEAKHLSVYSNNKLSLTLKASELPEVYLKGKISVADATDELPPEITKEIKPEPNIVKINKTDTPIQSITDSKPKIQPILKKRVRKNLVNKVISVKSTENELPRSISKAKTSFAPKSVDRKIQQATKKTNTSTLKNYLKIIAFAGALFVFIATLFGESVIVAQDNRNQSSQTEYFEWQTKILESLKTSFD